MITHFRLLDRFINSSQEVDWGAVYSETLPQVYNYFRYRVCDGALAEDLTAATFEKAWRSRERYRRDRSAFTTWLFTIARRVAIDAYRSRPPEESLDDAQPGGEETSPEAVAQRREDLWRLSSLLSGLSERERELVALKYGAEMTNRAIARQTGLSETNVGTLLFRIVEKLRAAWEEEE